MTKELNEKTAAVEKAAEKVAEKVEKKAPAKKPAVKAAAKPAVKAEKVEKAAPVKKPAAKKPAVKKAEKVAEVLIQSPMGGEITPAAVLAKVPADVDTVYVRVDQNKAYWVKGEETGSVDLW